MKRSLFIAIVVLLMAALFVSCNAEKSMEDQLVEVTIDGGARALSASGTMDIDVEGLYWYYTAEKTSGYFREGQKTSLTAIVGTGTDGKGIATASLGSMSTGGWKFCFYGFTDRPENPANMTKEQAKAAAILYQADLKKVITETIALSVSLSRGEGALADPVAVFADGLFWKDEDGVFAQSLDGTLSLVITNNDEVVKIYQTETVSEGKAVFNPISDITLEVGPNELVFEVYYSFEDDGVDLEEKLGYYPLTISAESGMTYTIASDSNGIPFYAGDTQVAVTINGATAPVVTNNAIVASTTQGKSKVEAANTPAAGGTEVKTTVEFPIDLTGKQLTVETSSAEVASAKAFAVSTDSAVVGSISLSISDGTTTFGTGNTATISTFIGKNLGNDDDIEVHYAGTDAADVDQNTVHYDPATGYVTFETSHFSEFYVTAKGEAKIGSRVYNTLVEAIADAQNGATITLLQNVATVTQIEIAGKTIALDLNGKSITYSGTSTLTSGVILVHNGASLTIDDLSTGATGAVISGENAYAAVAVTKAGDNSAVPATLIVNNGTFRGYYYAVTGNGSRHNTAITINGGVLEGTNGSAVYHPQNGTLTITGGTLTGYETAVEIRAGNVTIDGGTFTATSTTVDCAANGSGTTTKGVAIAVAQHTTKLPINVTINGGSFNAKRTLLCSNPQNNSAEDIAKVNVTINGGQFSSSDCALNVYDGLSLTINNATVSAQEACVLLINAGKVLINGGTFTSIDNFVVGTNGSAGCGGNEITITGGTFNGGITSTGYVACGVYLANDDTLTINDGTFVITGGAGIVARAGQTVINGGSFECTGTATGKVGDSRVVVPCNAIVFDEAAAYPGLTNESRITVNGGSFTTDYEDFYSTVPANPSIERIILNGTFGSGEGQNEE